MTICRKCGTSNPDGKKFCTFCHELLIADPVELEKRADAEQKKQQKQQRKMQKKLDAKHKRWKRALLLLIPIGVLDLLVLILCLDLAFIGIGAMLGSALGEGMSDILGNIIELFGNQVYTDQFVGFLVRGLEFSCTLGLLLIASVLAVVMIVRMIKWRIYQKKSVQVQEDQGASASASAQDTSTADLPIEEQGVETVRAAMDKSGVCYEALLQAGEKQRANANAKPAPASETTCRAVFDALLPRLWEYDEDSVRRILSCMSASRMLLCSAGALDSAAIFDTLSGAFGTCAEQFICPALQELDGQSDGDVQNNVTRVLLQTDEATGKTRHTSFASALYTATFTPAHICFAGVSGIGANEIEDVFAPFASYFGVPEGNVALYLGQPAANTAFPEGIDEGKLVLPANLWVLDVLPEQDAAPSTQGKVARYAAMLYLRNSGRAFPPEQAEDAQQINVSVGAWERAVAAAENAYALSDELWSVMDLVERMMIDAGGKGFANRTLRMLEKYTSVFLALGGKMQDAFDNGFAAVVAPTCAAQLRAVAERQEGETLSAMLERTVGKEKLPMTVQALTSMGIL